MINRRFVIIIVIIIHSFLLTAEKSCAQQRPNIIFILGDDISQEDIGCYGNMAIHTPNIDQMAENGIKFNNAFVTSSSCSPSRCSIITARYPHNTGAAELHTGLPEHLTYFPELLKKAGYYTAQAGKWHEGLNTLRAYDTLLSGVEINGDGGEEQWINLLNLRPRDKPFFFWFAPFDSHRDWGADQFRNPHEPEKVIIPLMLADTKETRRDIASYYNEIGRIDYYLGELYQALESQGITSNTIVIFMSDNARPFPGSKTRLYDRGIKTPFIIKWPAKIKKKLICQSLISSIDIGPTLFELAGVEPVESMQGKSFAELLTNPKSKFRNYIFAEHNWHDFEAYERSVRTADFFYLINLRPQFDNEGAIDVNQSPSASVLRAARANGTITNLQNDVFIMPRPQEEFFDLKKDPLQQHNLIDDPSYAKQIQSLKNILKKWRRETGDTDPRSLTPDWYDRQTGRPLKVNGTRREMPGMAKRADYINKNGPF
jgi:N-sulfoglucosamine sulfohydrolase